MNGFEDYQLQLTACQTLIQRGKWPQAVVFVISPRLNTQDLAGLLMRQLVCLHTTQQACPSCPLQLYTHPDIRLVERAEEETTLNVGTIKQAIRHLYQSPLLSQKKILFIPQAESLSPEAANALLKPIEDYKADRHLILFTSDIQKLLPTVRSRSVVFHLPGKLKPKQAQSTDSSDNPLAADLQALPQAILSRSPERFQLTERIHKTASDVSQSQVRRLLTEQASEWQNIFLREHRKAQTEPKKQQLRHLAQMCEQLPQQLNHHVSLKSALDILISCV